MIVHDAIQGSENWRNLRLGIPTCSQFHRILTPSTRKLSAQSTAYAIELCTEYLLGQPVDAGASQWTRRGSELENEAASWYGFDRDVKVEKIGFCTTDDGRWGGSPDGLIGDSGLIEIKCLSAVNQTAALLGATNDGYVLQAQGYLLLTDRKWIDRCWYNPSIKPVVQHVERDDDLIAELAQAVEDFADRLAGMKARLIEMGCCPKGKP